MDAKQITRALWAVVVLWLLSATVVAERAAAGEPALPPAINLIMFAGLSTLTLALLVIRSHVGLAGRTTRVTKDRSFSVSEDVAELRADVERLNNGLDHRAAVMYRDFNRRVDHVNMRLDQMTDWMMRPAVPRTPARATASVAVRTVDQETQPLPIVVEPNWEAELRGYLAWENTEKKTDDEN